MHIKNCANLSSGLKSAPFPKRRDIRGLKLYLSSVTFRAIRILSEERGKMTSSFSPDERQIALVLESHLNNCDFLPPLTVGLKSQIPNHKFQINPKFQFQMTKNFFSVWNSGHWNLFVIWCLEIGAFTARGLFPGSHVASLPSYDEWFER